MACGLYNNNGFKCGACEHFVRAKSVTLSGTTLIINIETPSVKLVNKQKICICVDKCIPDEVTSADTVVITIGSNTTEFPLITDCGNFVHADQIRTRKVYHTNFATDMLAFVTHGCKLCKTAYNFPVITV